MKNIKRSLVLALSFSFVFNAQGQDISNGFKVTSFSGFKNTETQQTISRNEAPSVIPQTSNLNRISSRYLPIAFTFYGFASLGSRPLKNINYTFREEILEHRPTGRNHIDDYLQYTPALATFAFKLAGKSGKSDFINSIRIFAISNLMMAGSVLALKKTTGEVRPDGSNNSSFPSGHTATAFASAEFLRQEFKDTAPLLSYSGYVAAAATGGIRMYNNKHFFSDVLAGAGIGILSTKAAYWVNKKLFASKHSQSKIDY